MQHKVFIKRLEPLIPGKACAKPNVFVSDEVFAEYEQRYKTFRSSNAFMNFAEIKDIALASGQLDVARKAAWDMHRLTGVGLPEKPSPAKPPEDFTIGEEDYTCRREYLELSEEYKDKLNAYFVEERKNGLRKGKELEAAEERYFHDNENKSLDDNENQDFGDKEFFGEEEENSSGKLSDEEETFSGNPADGEYHSETLNNFFKQNEEHLKDLGKDFKESIAFGHFEEARIQSMRYGRLNTARLANRDLCVLCKVPRFSSYAAGWTNRKNEIPAERNTQEVAETRVAEAIPSSALKRPATLARGERSPHASGERSPHASGERFSHAHGARPSHASGERVSHASGDFSLSNPVAQREDSREVYAAPDLFFDDDGMPRHLVEQPYSVPLEPPFMAAGKSEEEWTKAEKLAAEEYHFANQLTTMKRANYEGRYYEEMERLHGDVDFPSDEQFEEASKYYAIDPEHFYKKHELQYIIDEAKAGRAEEVGAASVRRAMATRKVARVVLQEIEDELQAKKKAKQQKDCEGEDDSAGSQHSSRGPP